jgi:hypothetical protein
MLDQFTFCLREFHFVMRTIQLVIVAANGRLFALIITKIVGMSVGPLGCQFCCLLEAQQALENIVT